MNLVCHHCKETENFSWSFTVRNGGFSPSSSVVIFALGCDFCSETLAIIDGEDVVNFLNTDPQSLVKSFRGKAD